MTPEHITALAEACEQAARDAEALRAHAAALRAGRVTITEEAT